MISIVLAMLAIILLAASVVLYVAFPHRGEPVPHAPWLGDFLKRTVALFPSLQHDGKR